jgi:hypothetical protein
MEHVLVWGTRVSNLFFMRLAAEWTVWRGKNRLRDSDNDRTPLPFFHSLQLLRHPRDTCDTLPLGMVPHANRSNSTASKPCGGVTPYSDINIARGVYK